MLSISIISACNNNCDYCFQKDSYHTLNAMLSYDEVMDIAKWGNKSQTIGILGGEPTLHPDCIRICQDVSKQNRVCMLTNLLCDTKILEELLLTTRMGWLINTTTRDSLKPLFEENAIFLNKVSELNDCKFTFGITLTGNFEQDVKFIDNLIRIGKKYPYMVGWYRIAFATPCHDKIYKLKSYNKSILYFYKKSKKDTPEIPYMFDCLVNSCYMSDETFLKIIKDTRMYNYNNSCCYEPRVDVLVDKTVNYCSSCPDWLFEKKYYTDFQDWEECSAYFLKAIKQFNKKHSEFYCKKTKFCTNKSCSGICVAIAANLLMQEKKLSNFTQSMHEFRYNLINKLGL